MLFFKKMQSTILYRSFIEYKKSLCLYLSQKLPDTVSSSSDAIFNKSKKEPVRSQQYLVKRDCDSERGLPSSAFTIAIYCFLLQTVLFYSHSPVDLLIKFRLTIFQLLFIEILFVNNATII